MSEGRTFEPTIREDGLVLAGGMALFTVDEGGRLVFEDRYRVRCRARGTDDVPVDVVELVEVLLDYLRERGAGWAP